MKKLLIFLIGSIGFLQTHTDSGLDKSKFHLRDGISFDQFEANFRKKYTHLNIPEIRVDKITDDPFSSVSAEYHINGHIGCNKDAISSYDSAAWELTMLHETGHAQKPYSIAGIQTTNALLFCVTPFVWGWHKTKPYKSIMTKLASKSLATFTLPALFLSGAMKLEEKRADNFANKYADKDALIGGIKKYEYLAADYNNYCKAMSDAAPFYIPKNILYYYFKYSCNPLHPTNESRIAKMKTALKSRFGIDA